MMWAHITIILAGLLLPVYSETLESSQLAFMCGQLVSQQASGKCSVHLHSRTDTTITLESGTGSTQHQVTADTPVWIDVPNFERVIEGIEAKGYILSSTDATFSAQVHSSLDDDTGDIVSLYPSPDGANTYYLISPVDATTEGCVGYTSYFSLAAMQDATSVTVTLGGVWLAAFTLERFETFTNRTDTLPGNADVDFTGAVIESDKPLSVTVGNRCYQRDSNDAQHSVWASMPPSSALGTTYMAANVGLDTLNAFGVKVMATEDATSVTADGVVSTIDALGFYTFLADSNGFYPEVVCSKPCAVLFFSKDETDMTGISASSVLDTAHFVVSTHFQIATAYDVDFEQYMFVVNEVKDGTGLVLDGESLDDDVRWVEYGTFSVLARPIEEGSHDLYSTSGTGFSVMISGKLPSVGHGYSYYLGGYAESDYTTTTSSTTTTTTTTTTPATTTTTTATTTATTTTTPSTTTTSEVTTTSDDGGDSTTTPEQCPIIPQHRIDLRDTYYTLDGSDLSDECVVAYSGQLNERASAMVPDVNGKIGFRLCNTMTLADMQVETPATSFLPTEGGEGLATVKFFVAVKNPELEIGAVLACIDEMEEYLVSHENWGIPILVPEDGCPAVQFTDYFWNNQPSEWLCFPMPTTDATDPASSSIQLAATDGNELGYVLGMRGFFSTADGSDLSAVCTQEYLESLAYETYRVSLIVNGMWDSICPNTDVSIFQVTSGISQEVIGGPTGQTEQFYYLNPGDATTFDELCACAFSLAEAVGPHNSGLWNEPPLPIEPGCPLLVFDPTEFMYDFAQYYCIDMATTE